MPAALLDNMRTRSTNRRERLLTSGSGVCLPAARLPPHPQTLVNSRLPLARCKEPSFHLGIIDIATPQHELNTSSTPIAIFNQNTMTVSPGFETSTLLSTLFSTPLQEIGNDRFMEAYCVNLERLSMQAHLTAALIGRGVQIQLQLEVMQSTLAQPTPQTTAI